MQTIFVTSSAKETKELAKSLVQQWMQPAFHGGALVIGFEGELGSGKTTFIQGVIEGLGVQDRVTSPTFVLMKRYQTPDGRNLYHIDCYRLNAPQEFLALGWNEIITNPQSLIFVEWADRVQSLLPQNSMHLQFAHISENKRQITIMVA